MTTTLTIPGGMPEGLPGTGGQRPKGGGPWTNKGPQRPKGPPGAGAPPGKRGRGRRNRRGGKPPGAPDSDNRGNEARVENAPRAVDDNRGNEARIERAPRTATTIAATRRVSINAAPSTTIRNEAWPVATKHRAPSTTTAAIRRRAPIRRRIVDDDREIASRGRDRAAADCPAHRVARRSVTPAAASTSRRRGKSCRWSSAHRG